MIIELKDYLYLSEGKDTTLAVQEALHILKANPGSTLKLGGGEYHFYKKYAFEKEYYISNNTYSKKSIIFPLMDMEDVTIDGEGADLLFHGEVLPFVLDNSKNVTLKNFSIDYPNPYFFQGEITAAEEDFIEVTFDTSQFNARVDEKFITFFNTEDGWEIKKDRALTTEFDRRTSAPSSHITPYFLYLPNESDGSFLDGMYRYVTGTQLADNKIRFDGHFGHTHNVGNMLICTCAPGRNCPGILINKTRDVVINTVTLHSTIAMGIIGQLSENITLDTVKTVPREGSGRYLSVNADSTHFVNCSGFIRYENCVFTNMLDDAGNVHGNYLKIEKIIDEHSLLLTFGHPEQEGVNIFDAGDVVRLVDNKKMTELACVTVKNATLISSKYVRLETVEKLPELQIGNTVENFTKMPELYINNCITGYNRPRGFLPSTWKKTVITNNTFFNMSCGLHFTGDSNDWFESGHVEDVLIMNNKFKNSAYAGGSAICINPHVLEGTTPYHRNIIIEDNDFEMHEERFLIASFIKNLVFRNNRFIKNEDLPSHAKVGEKGYVIHPTCVDAIVEDPKTE